MQIFIDVNGEEMVTMSIGLYKFLDRQDAILTSMYEHGVLDWENYEEAIYWADGVDVVDPT